MAKDIEVMYWLPHCSTCQKAKDAIEETGAKIHRFVDLKETPLAKEEIESLCEKAGGVNVVFSKVARKYRALGLDKLELSDADMLSHMVEEYTFIRRPVVVVKKGPTLVGFKSKEYATVFQ
jgi:arsenate reductase (glutaredoxin)